MRWFHSSMLLVFLGQVFGQTPVVVDGGVLNAASSARGQAVAPGALISIYGTDLAPSQLVASAIPLPMMLGDVSVTINNIPAPLLFVAPGQINAQLPVNVPAGMATVVVRRGAVSSAGRAFAVAASAPGIFTASAGVGQAIAIHTDGALVAPAGAFPGSRPANAGDTIIILGTGMGAVEPAIASGVSGGSVLRNTLARPTVLIGGRDAAVAFSGLSPEFVGVNQWNVVVPAGVTGGDRVPIQIRSGAITSTDQATIAIAGGAGGGPRRLREISSLPILGSSPRSVALNGNIVYVCGSENIAVVDVADPANPRILTRVGDDIFNSVGNLACYVDSSRLIATADTGNSAVTGTSPSVAVFQLSNPAQPVLLRATAINKNFMGAGYVRGNNVFVPTSAINFSGSTFLDQRGDVLSVDVADPNNMRVVSTLFTGTPGFSPVTGGVNSVFYIAAAGATTALAASSTSTGTATATGTGRILVIDTANAAELRLVRDVPITGTRQAFTIVVDNDLAVVAGNVEGWRNPVNFPLGALVGPTTVTTLNISDPQRPTVIRTVTTPFRPDLLGTGAAIIGPRQYMFGGIRSGDQSVFLLVDATDPNNPAITSMNAPVIVRDVRFANGLVFAALEGSGLGIYRVE